MRGKEESNHDGPAGGEDEGVERGGDRRGKAVRKGGDHGAGRRGGHRTGRHRARLARSRSTSRRVSAGTRGGGSSRSTAPSRAERRPWRCTPSRKRRSAGGVAAFIDAEHALDVAYARAIGVATEKLLVSQPDTGEQALEIIEMLVRIAGGRPRRHRLGGGAHSEGRARRRDGRRRTWDCRLG